MATLQKIRQKIINREYYISSHAEEELLDDNLERKEEELLDDNLERKDIENAILKGWIDRKIA